MELEPLNLNANDNLAGEYLSSRQYDQVIEYEKKTLEIDPTYAQLIFAWRNGRKPPNSVTMRTT